MQHGYCQAWSLSLENVGCQVSSTWHPVWVISSDNIATHTFEFATKALSMAPRLITPGLNFNWIFPMSNQLPSFIRNLPAERWAERQTTQSFSSVVGVAGLYACDLPLLKAGSSAAARRQANCSSLSPVSERIHQVCLHWYQLLCFLPSLSVWLHNRLFLRNRPYCHLQIPR